MTPRHTRLFVDQPGARSAFTLIELVVTIVVVSIIAGLGTAIIVEGGRAYAKSRTLANNLTDARYGVDRLARELQGVATPSDITALGASSISFNLSGVSRTFALSGTNLVRNGKVLVRDVTAFRLTSYDSSGAITANPASVWRVAIEVTANRDGLPASVRTEVFPRAFRTSYVAWQEQ